MKLSVLFLALAFSDDTEKEDDQCYRDNQPCKSKRGGTGNGLADGTPEELAERRFNDLKGMFKKLWQKNGMRGKKNGWNEETFWNYGCHCTFMRDNPFSGLGQPKDPLDVKCKAFKNCLKCVTDEHGPECNHDQRKYAWKWSGKLNALVGVDQDGSCEKDLFRCGKQFAYDTLAVKDVFHNQYHPMKAAEEGKTFDSYEQCFGSGGAGSEHQCCGGQTNSYKWISLNKFQCCSDGHVMPADEPCPGY